MWSLLVGGELTWILVYLVGVPLVFLGVSAFLAAVVIGLVDVLAGRDNQ